MTHGISVVPMEFPASGPLIGAIGSYWFLVAILVGSAVVDWLKKRAAAADPNGASRPTQGQKSAPSSPPPASAPGRRPSQWEKELERMLGIERPPEPSPTQLPPPVPSPAVRRPGPASARRPVELPPTRGIPPLAKVEPEFTEAHRVSEMRMPELKESSTAYTRASRLQEQVAGQMKEVDDQTERHLLRPRTIRVDSAASEAARVISLLRQPRTARQAVIASVIFSSPKGLAAD